MSINAVVIGLLSGAIGAAIVRFWAKNKGKAIEAVSGTFDKIEARTGFDIPDRIEDAVQVAVKSAVDVLDTQFSNPRFWRDIIKLATGRAPELAVDKFLEAFKKVDWADSLAAQVPAEYLELFNWARERLAVKMAESAVVAAMPVTEKLPALPSEEKMVAAVRASVAASRYDNVETDEVMEEVNRAAETTIEKLIRESKERKAKLMEKK